MKIAINGEILEVSGLPEGAVPVKPLTKAEYDALTDEERQADVVYAITDDGGSLGSNGYRCKTVESDVITASQILLMSEEELGDPSKIMFISAVCYSSEYMYPLPYYTFSVSGTSSNSYLTAANQVSLYVKSGLRVFASNAFLNNNWRVKATVYYTVEGVSGSGGTSEEVYSTEETRIGTWIDGKPLYRRVLDAQTGGADIVTVHTTLSDIEYISTVRGTISYYDGTVGSSGSFVPLPSNLGLIGFNPYTQKVWSIVTGSPAASRPMRIILEYTKTTDTGGAA